jgi:hypothetical protein
VPDDTPEAAPERAGELNRPSVLSRKASVVTLKPAEKHSLHLPILWGMVVALLILWGTNAHLERYITPQRGLGYWLGIIGGSMMLLLLVYSARKRAAWLRWLGGVPSWFQIHMVLGVVGPLLVLFHSNFHLGATNSNVALICMLLVAGSGVIGRYIYTRLHAHLDGKQDSLEDLQAIAEKIRTQTTAITFLPGLLDAIDREEQRLVNPAAGAVLRLLHVFTSGLRAALARWRLHALIHQAVVRAIEHESEEIVAHARRIRQVARGYADRRLDTGRRVAEYRVYARLFSFWHVLHIPLFFMLLIAGIAHVIAVNVY